MTRHRFSSQFPLHIIMFLSPASSILDFLPLLLFPSPPAALSQCPLSLSFLFQSEIEMKIPSRCAVEHSAPFIYFFYCFQDIAFKTYDSDTAKMHTKGSLISRWPSCLILILKNEYLKGYIFKPLNLITLWNAKKKKNLKTLLNSVHIINHSVKKIGIHWFSVARDSFWNVSFP